MVSCLSNALDMVWLKSSQNLCGHSIGLILVNPKLVSHHYRHYDEWKCLGKAKRLGGVLILDNTLFHVVYIFYPGLNINSQVFHI